MESRIQLKPVLGDVIIVSLSISSHEQTQYKPSMLFSYIDGSLYFWRIRFSRLFVRGGVCPALVWLSVSFKQRILHECTCFIVFIKQVGKKR